MPYKDMKTTYVVIKYWGSYSDKEVHVLYAGDSHEIAKDKADKGKFTESGLIDGEITEIVIEHWENGEMVNCEQAYS